MRVTILDAENASPLYVQLMHKLRAEITEGVYPVHSRIPSEQELCDTYQVSRVTVRKALAELTREGLLERHQGKGTYVAVPRLRKDLRHVNSFYEVCMEMHCRPETQVLRAQLTQADSMDRESGLCDSSDSVVEVVRVRLADGQPVMLENNHFSADYEWILRENLTGSLYALLRQKGIEAEQATHEISLCYASATDARQLDVEPGSALLALNEVIYDQQGRPLHTSRQKIRGDRFTFRI
ncbi:MAG: GntR family transcriptional regulator [Clostridia bacterium]|nr:GntR family transcriptional regulator [Clostridia bacterium]